MNTAQGVGSTQPSRVEEQLRDAETRYRSIFQDFPISLWEEDFSEVKQLIRTLRDGGVRDFRAYFEDHPEATAVCADMVKVIDVNRATLQMYEARSVELFRDGLRAVFTDESYETFKEQLVAIAEGKCIFEGRAVTRTMSGKRKLISLRWCAAPGYEDSLARVFVSVIDITEQDWMNSELSASEERFRALSEAAFEGVAIHDEGKILEANAALSAMFGFKHSELIGMDGLDLVVAEERDLACQVILSGDEEPHTFKGIRKDGTAIWLEIRARRIRYRGRQATVTAIRELPSPHGQKLAHLTSEVERTRQEPPQRQGDEYALTSRELSILQLVADGTDNRDIATELGITHATVKQHVRNVLRKMRATSRTQAVARALRAGIIR